MKTLIAIAFLFVIIGCLQFKSTKIDQTSSLVVDDLRYSAYSWYYPTRQWEFYLDYYVHIDKSGNFNIMFRDSLMSKPKYFKGIINDTIRNCIDKIFQVDTFKADYKTAELQNIAYSGLTYCFDFKKDTSNKKIVFIQTHSPTELKRLSTLLDNLVNTTNPIKVDTIAYANYLEELKRFSSASLEALPVIDTTPFKPVKIPR